MKCEICGKSPGIHGITLLRQNPKSEIGIWRCEGHSARVDPEVAQVVAEIQHALNTKRPAP